jgi:hypothetical protein
MRQFERTDAFARDATQERLLHELNDLLGAAEDEALRDQQSPPALPTLFIVGAPRSGTTLLLQWLAASGSFAYPSNLLSRFYRAPYLGSRIQQLLTSAELDYRNELVELRSIDSPSWRSDVGKTRGVLEPHEFSFFWRRFFPIAQAQKLTDEQLAASDPAGFAAGWGAIERAFGKPVAAKGILLQYDIRRLAEWLPRAVFVHTRRDAFANVRSLLGARERVFGTPEAWFSVQPPEYEWLRHEDPYTQTAGQVLFTNRSIEAELEALPAHRVCRVQYESFCADPGNTWKDLRSALAEQAIALQDYTGPTYFEPSSQSAAAGAAAAQIRSALERLSDK